MTWHRDVLFLGLVGGGLVALGLNLAPPSDQRPAEANDASYTYDADIAAAVGKVDATFRERWRAAGLTPAAPAADLLVARRLALGLMGTVPSLEEVRRFEAAPPGDRLGWWVEHVLADRRHADYFAERFARATVGTEDGRFVLYRPRRYVTWLADQFARNRPYDDLVRELIAGSGLWTDHPATNFVTVTSQQGKGNQPDPVRLAGRVTRAFLGLRLDCAQCHDHPFAVWKQGQFEGLSAYFGQTHVGFTGVRDGPGEYEVEERKTKATRAVPPAVPFAPELVPEGGSRREQLAAWVTHPQNPYFARAAVNRVWALLFGRPLVAPVDNLESDRSPDREQEASPALAFLADDFVAHEYDLRRLVRVIAATEVFRLDSAAGPETGDKEEQAWAVFPLTRLRPEQVAGSVLQAASVSTINSRSHILARLIKGGLQNDFVTRYGDTGEDEFEGRGGTIPQRLVMMNGSLVREKTKDSPLNASTRIAWMAPDDRAAVEVAYLAILTRRPTPPEAAPFEAFLRDPELKRSQRLEDLYWALVNATEFSWNH